jgi:hypothetical protein
MNETGARPRGLGFASGVLWVLTGLLVAAAAVMIAMYGRFQEDSDRACSQVADLEPPGGWSDASFPCEQLGPMAWYLPYWGAVAGCLVFAALFLVAAVLTGRSHPRARGFALWTGIAAVVLLAVPGLLDLGRVLGSIGANQADSLVADRLHEMFPAWVETMSTVVQALVIVGVAAAVWLLSRPEVRAFLKRR